MHDANIVATMQTYSISALLTHNTKEFERFGKIIRIKGIWRYSDKPWHTHYYT